MAGQILGVIPARMNSTRFHGKPLKLILKKPMIQWVYENAKKCKSLDRLVVATDSEQIRDAVLDFKGEAILTGADHQTGLDRIIEVSELWNEYRYIINIQGDEPAIHPDTINGVVQTLTQTPDCQIATAAIAFTKRENFLSPHQVKVVFNGAMKALYFSRSPIPYRADPENLSEAYKHLGIYGYKKDALGAIQKLKTGVLENLEKLEQLRMLENNMNIYVYITRHDSIGVDTPDDIQKAEEFLLALGHQ